MNNFKKGLSLIAVIAFLITALIPLSALAADLEVHAPVPAPGSVVAPPPAAASIYGQLKAGDPNSGVLSYPNVGLWNWSGFPTGAPIDVYVWMGSTIQFTMPSPASAALPQWFVTGSATAPANVTAATFTSEPQGTAYTMTLTPEILGEVIPEPADAIPGQPYNPFAGNAGNVYVVGRQQTNSSDGQALYTQVYRLIPVQAAVYISTADNTSPAAQPVWGSTGQQITANWAIVNYPDGALTTRFGIGTIAPPGGTLSCYVYDTGVVAPLNIYGNTPSDMLAVDSPTAQLAPRLVTTNAELPVKVAGTTGSGTPTYQYHFYGQSRYQTASQTIAVGDVNLSNGPITSIDQSGGSLTRSPLQAVLNADSWTTSPTDERRVIKYSQGIWSWEQIVWAQVRPFLPYTSTTPDTSAIGTLYTVPAKMGAVTVLKAQLPYDSYGTWTINYNDGVNWYTFSQNNTQNIALSHQVLPTAFRNGDVKVTDVPAVGLGQMGTSQLEFVVPKPANGTTTLLDNITVTFQARTYCDWNNPSDQLFTPQPPATMSAAWPADGNVFAVSNQIQFGVIPTLEDPNVGTVAVTPATRIVAKDQTATFNLELTPPGGLVIQSVTASRTSSDEFLGDGEDSTRPVSLGNLKPNASGSGTQWDLETKDIPVGTYRIDFTINVQNPDVAPGTPDYTYPLTGTSTLKIVEFQGRILNSSEPKWQTWSTRTGQLSVAQNRVLKLDTAWLDQVYPRNPQGHVDPEGNPTAVTNAWTVKDSRGNGVPNAASYLRIDPSADSATFTMPAQSVSANWPWTIEVQPVDSNNANVGVPATFVVAPITASRMPAVSGYFYEVSPEEDTYPTDGVMSSFQVSGQQNSRNIPVIENSTAAAYAVAGSTFSFSPVLSLQNDPDNFDYQWMVLSGTGWTELVEGPEVSGVKAAVLTIGASANTKGWQLYCKVTNKSDSKLAAGSNDEFVDLQVWTPGAVDTSAAPLPLITSNPSTGTNPVQNPTNVTTVAVSTGMQVTFTAHDENSTDGAPAPLPNDILRFQWRSSKSANGPFTDIEGANGPTYTVTASQETSNTYYQCHVTNLVSQGQKTGDSNKIRLTVHAPDGTVWFSEPATTPNPFNIRPGATVTMKTTAQSDNGDAVKYQWQVARVSRNTSIDEVLPGAWSDVTGATSAELTTGPLTNGYYFYRCNAANVTNAGKNATSLPFRVNVTALSNIPVVSPQHLSGDKPNFIPMGAEVGTSVTFSVTASVPTADPLVYTWKMVGPDANGAFQDPTNAANATILAGGSDGQLVIDAPMAYNGNSFVCQVSNANDPTAYTYSAIWNLTVWPDGTVPNIIEEPKDIIATYIDAYSNDASTAENRQSEVEVALPMPNDQTSASVNGQPNADYPGRGQNITLQVFSGGRWVDVTPTRPTMANGLPYQSVMDLLQKTPQTGIYNTDKTAVTWKAEATLGLDAYLANGEYRFAVTGYEPIDTEWTAPLANGNATGVPVPTAYTDPFVVNITVVGQPVVSNPASRTVQIGESATFSVTATVEPSTTQLTYRWQKSQDGGETWENCLDSDGTGAGTPSFTTVPATVEMQNVSPLYYRCIVQNLNTQQSATSGAARLEINDAPMGPATQITVAEGSNLTITEKDGVKYLCGTGLTVSKDGTTVSSLLEMLQPAPEGYTLKVLGTDGAEKAADAIVGSCDKVALIADASGQNSDEAVIVVRGDVLGTGQMSLTQLVRMAEAYKGTVTLEGAALMAGDLTGTGSISLTDLVQEATIYKAEMMDSTEPIPSQEPAE